MELKKEINLNQIGLGKVSMNLSTLHGLSHHIIRQKLEDIKLKIWLSDINNINNMVRK